MDIELIAGLSDGVDIVGIPVRNFGLPWRIIAGSSLGFLFSPYPGEVLVQLFAGAWCTIAVFRASC